MIMINDGDYSVMYNIEKTDQLFEVNYIEGQSQLMKDLYVNTGFQAIYRFVEDGDDPTIVEERYYSNMLDRLYLKRR
jgi:hypothetical protein